MKLSYAFVDFDKAFDKVSREANICALMKVSVAEWLISTVISI